MIYGAIACMVLAALVAFANITGYVQAARRSKKGVEGGYSSGALLSLLFSTVAYLLARDTIGLWAFVPAILDPGTWVLFAFPIAMIMSFREGKERADQGEGQRRDEPSE